jgi:Fur family transcriptional regulator, iron response regulator
MSSIYNIVRQFTEAGLLRQRILTGGFVVYDTDLRDHQHFIVEGTGEIIDLPDAEVTVAGVPEPPEGFEVAGVELVVRLRARPTGR